MRLSCSVGTEVQAPRQPLKHPWTLLQAPNPPPCRDPPKPALFPLAYILYHGASGHLENGLPGSSFRLFVIACHPVCQAPHSIPGPREASQNASGTRCQDTRSFFQASPLACDLERVTSLTLGLALFLCHVEMLSPFLCTTSSLV